LAFLACQPTIAAARLQNALSQRYGGRNFVSLHILDGNIFVLVDVFFGGHFSCLPVNSGDKACYQQGKKNNAKVIFLLLIRTKLGESRLHSDMFWSICSQKNVNQ